MVLGWQERGEGGGEFNLWSYVHCVSQFQN